MMNQLSEPIQSEESTDTTSEHQQKIIELIQSDDIQNHRLASVMSSGIPIQWDDEFSIFYLSIRFKIIVLARGKKWL